MDNTTVKRPSCSIRLASCADAASIAVLGAQVFAATYGHSVSLADLQYYLGNTYSTSAVLQDINDAKKTILVADDSDGTLLGYAYVARDTNEPCLAGIASKAELQRLYVSPSVHGRGIGKLLAGEAEALIRNEGIAHLWLGVWEHNTKAISFYERRGYAAVGKHMFSIGKAPQRDVIMLKKWNSRGTFP